MTRSKFKVLLYSDGSHQAFSAAVYNCHVIKEYAQYTSNYCTNTRP